MGWDGMGWDGMGWDGMGWDWDGKGLGWDGRSNVLLTFYMYVKYTNNYMNATLLSMCGFMIIRIIIFLLCNYQYKGIILFRRQLK